MKKLSALLSLALGLCLLPAIHAADPKAAPKPGARTAPVAAKAEPKAAIEAKPEAEQPVVGILIERKDGSGGFLNLKVDGGWTITFLDKDKKEIEGDLNRAIIRYRKNLTNNQFILTRSSDGKSLRAPQSVKRPYIFPALPVLLFKEGQEGVAESYVVQFKQPMPGDGEGIPIDEMTPEQLEKVPAPK